MTNLCYPKTSSLLSVEQAQLKIRTATASIEETETLSTAHALGRVLAQSVTAPIDIPPQRQAAMDGYAFASSDIDAEQAVSLRIAGYSWAGRPYTGELPARHCIRIFTGAVVPDAADSVITQEQVDATEEHITLPAGTPAYKNIRAAGSDVKRRETLIAAPKTLTASDLALLAAAGINTVCVKRRLKIAYFSTGDELVAPGHPLGNGQIYDSNRPLLANLLSNPNYQLTDLGTVEDDQAALEQTLLAASRQHDVIISSGGASVGDADFIRQTLENIGHVDFWKLAIKPGKPLAFGRIGNSLFFGLPGNPIAVLVTFDKFVAPALRQLTGAPNSTPLQLRARCENQLKKSPGRQEYQRGIVSQAAIGEFTVRLAGPQDSHQLRVASQANCFIVLEADCSGVEAGEMVTIEPFQVLI